MVSLIRKRLHDARLLTPPTVQHELIPVRHGIAERIAQRLREQRLIPEEEVNDSLVLAESALLGCSLLLTSDEHLRGVDFERLTLELRSFDVPAPVIATPREIVRKFFMR